MLPLHSPVRQDLYFESSLAFYYYLTRQTGVAVYYFSPKWPFKANSIVSIDSQPAVTVDLTDNSVPLSDQDRAQNASSPSAVVWSITGLSNDTHNILITRSDDSEGMAVVDGFM